MGGFLLLVMAFYVSYGMAPFHCLIQERKRVFNVVLLLSCLVNRSLFMYKAYRTLSRSTKICKNSSN